MVDVEAAIGYVVAHGDVVDRARLSYLRSGTEPSEQVLEKAEFGDLPDGGWPALASSAVPSVDATCYRLSELVDLGALNRPVAQAALRWLASRQSPEGAWQEDESLAAQAPQWAQPGDPEATVYLTVNAAFWLAVAAPPSRYYGDQADYAYAGNVRLAAEAFRASLGPHGEWPSYLAAGWLGCALLFYSGLYYESAQIQVILAERVPGMTPGDTASLAAALRRVGVADDDWVVQLARRRLTETQRPDGAWESDDGRAFDVHTTLTAIRAMS
ncbi:hypothetical protein Val02_15010 [Virgisporangium aliadipatigenens]|uniref:Uncharacterized protein n=1 Tax=Virgisporangium aliadipatigenens TaxID=741659 RepID=A0A8J3YIG7_9ACTN|nr:squalene--hopene cyclase [Virgisporangium aliadipatigenens]GIJ44615.1 hypothetical protein Val02_15010 [Virgisporangium aliadipatigenens]